MHIIKHELAHSTLDIRALPSRYARQTVTATSEDAMSASTVTTYGCDADF